MGEGPEDFPKLHGGEGYHQKLPFGSNYKSNACRPVARTNRGRRGLA
jgi:hypothetical protein